MHKNKRYISVVNACHRADNAVSDTLSFNLAEIVESSANCILWERSGLNSTCREDRAFKLRQSDKCYKDLREALKEYKKRWR